MASVDLPAEMFETEELRAIWVEVNRNVVLWVAIQQGDNLTITVLTSDAKN